jgi:hypothetical protein
MLKISQLVMITSGLLLGSLTAHSSEREVGIAIIKGTLTSITKKHYVIRTSDQTLCYVKKSAVDKQQRRRLREINRFVVVSVDMTKVEIVREPASKKAKLPPSGQ